VNINLKTDTMCQTRQACRPATDDVETSSPQVERMGDPALTYL
jgi:hypothetical protein